MSKKQTESRRTGPWTRPRHRVVWAILRPFLRLYGRLKYGVRAERFRGTGPHLILFNHQTPFDQFFVTMSFPGAVYYLATEDIFSIGWPAKVMSWGVAPIPIRKQSTDTRAIRTMIQVAREGGTVCLAPEGNRTYSGKTEYMRPAVASLAKKLGLPIALYRIEGGYGVEPRWSDRTRRGSMRAGVARVIPPEEYQAMSNEALYEEIRQGLYVNEAVADAEFRSNRRAEYLERAVYVCPFCGLTVFHSEGNELECERCHRWVHYRPDKRLEGVRYDFPFEFVNDWYEYQKDYVNHLDLTQHTAEPMFRDRAAVLRVIPCERKVPLRKEASLELYGDRVTVGGDWTLPFAEITAAAVLGRNKLNLYHGGEIYQFKGDKRFNALKYVNLIHRYKNMAQGDEHGEFLGL
ncbi:MAG: 1-acyl-sn-glycerol-3-phosphate acyltransferase [Oscillospiraceae bacterium]|nr:1-acyl-sn-glycerol-3-phosphate acyltransferase [Oscillospiraceae bacterium]